MYFVYHCAERYSFQTQQEGEAWMSEITDIMTAGVDAIAIFEERQEDDVNTYNDFMNKTDALIAKWGYAKVPANIMRGYLAIIDHIAGIRID